MFLIRSDESRRRVTAKPGVGAVVLAGMLLAGARPAAAEVVAGLPATITFAVTRVAVVARGMTTVTAKVVDSAGAPLAGVLVRFSFVDGANGGMVTPTAITNAEGVVVVSVQAGAVPGGSTIRADAEGGANPTALVTLEVTPPAPHLNRNYFNPTKGERLRIAVDVQGSARLAVTVVGMSGELIRDIDPGQMASGAVTREWDGRSATGETVPSGIYFVRVQNGATLQIRRVIVLRI